MGEDGEVRYARHGEGHLAYRMWGEGPPLIYVPSQFIAISDMDDEPAHERFLLSLAKFATAIVFDRRGIGLSDPMSAPPTIDGWVDQIVSVMDACGFDRAYLLAHLIGAVPSMTLAVNRPERVQGLILAMAVLHWGLPRDVDLDQLRATARPGEDAPVDLFAVLAPSRLTDARFREWWDRAGRRGASPAVAQALLDMHARCDARPLEAKVAVPTLVIDRPDRDWGLARPPSIGGAIPGVHAVEVPGVDAMPWLPDSEAVVAEIEEFITGRRRSAAVTRTLLTVMFTDVVGSTDTAARLGDAGWRDTLETHDRIMRRELARHDGREIDTAGDGFLVTFPAPTQALQCASRLHRAMNGIGVRLRIGIHCGEVEVRDHSLAGIAVHLAARIQAKAGPGETLISSTAREAMVGSDLVVSPRGRHTLKGVPGQWALFAADA